MKLTCMLAISLCLFTSSANAEQDMFNGFYFSGGGLYSKLKTDIFGVSKRETDTVPIVTIGYGISGRKIGDSLKLFVSVEGFYSGAGAETKATEMIIDRVVVETSRVVETVTRNTLDANGEVINDSDGNPLMETVTVVISEATRDVTDTLIEARVYRAEQQGTVGAGIRFGVTEQVTTKGGAIYFLFGYAATELEVEGGIVDPNDQSIISTNDTADFDGVYYGAGYEYAFNPNWSLRADYIRFNYGSETIDLVDGRSSAQTTSNNPSKVEMDSDGISISLTFLF